MLIVISSSKTLDFSKCFGNKSHTIPVFLKESEELISILRQFSIEELTNLLKISKPLAELNYKRFIKWDVAHPEKKSKIAILAFKGDTYKSLNANSFTTSDLEFASQHLRILSGLYGLLRPLDFIMPYRLEMTTNLKNNYCKALYKFWKLKINYELNKIVKENNFKIIINITSGEYFKVIDKLFNLPVLNITFKQKYYDIYKTKAAFSKKARGMMLNFIIKNRISKIDEIKSFNKDGYVFNPLFSTDSEWVYTR